MENVCKRFNNSTRCSSSKIISLFLSLIVEVFEQRRIRFDDARVSFICSVESEFNRFLISSSPSSKTTSERLVIVSH